MADITSVIPFWVEAVTIGAGAIAGSIRGLREELAISGVAALAVAVGLGGGLIRDTLLQSGVPRALVDWRYLPVVVVGMVIALALRGLIVRFEWLVFGADSLAIGLYTVIGADKALRHGVPPTGAVLVGVLAGTGGAMIADFIVGIPPAIFRPGPLMGIAAGMGATLFVVAERLTGQVAVWFVVGVVFITVTRVISSVTGNGVGPAGRVERVISHRVRSRIQDRQDRPE